MLSKLTVLALICFVIVLCFMADRGAGIGGVTNLLNVWFNAHSGFRTGVHGSICSSAWGSDLGTDSGMAKSSVLSNAKNRSSDVCEWENVCKNATSHNDNENKFERNTLNFANCSTRYWKRSADPYLKMGAGLESHLENFSSQVLRFLEYPIKKWLEFVLLDHSLSVNYRLFPDLHLCQTGGMSAKVIIRKEFFKKRFFNHRLQTCISRWVVSWRYRLSNGDMASDDTFGYRMAQMPIERMLLLHIDPTKNMANTDQDIPRHIYHINSIWANRNKRIK